MDYLNTYPDAYIRYHASDMVLYVNSDAAYLVAPKARSRIAGYYYLSDHPNVTKSPKPLTRIQRVLKSCTRRESHHLV